MGASNTEQFTLIVTNIVNHWMSWIRVGQDVAVSTFRDGGLTDPVWIKIPALIVVLGAGSSSLLFYAVLQIFHQSSIHRQQIGQKGCHHGLKANPH